MDDTGLANERSFVLDANAVAGLLEDVFGTEMTASPTVCAHCGRAGELGSLAVYVHAPGKVLRCPACDGIMVRIVRTPEAMYLDARGAVYLRIRVPQS
jgi:hypothetical protein